MPVFRYGNRDVVKILVVEQFPIILESGDGGSQVPGRFFHFGEGFPQLVARFRARDFRLLSGFCSDPFLLFLHLDEFWVRNPQDSRRIFGALRPDVGDSHKRQIVFLFELLTGRVMAATHAPDADEADVNPIVGSQDAGVALSRKRGRRSCSQCAGFQERTPVHWSILRHRSVPLGSMGKAEDLPEIRETNLVGVQHFRRQR